MNGDSIRLLLVEDDSGDARLIHEYLASAQVCRFEEKNVESLSECMNNIRQSWPEVILLDLHLPDSSGMETLERVNAACSNEPIIVLTGMNDDNLAIEALARGAQDYLVKGNISPELLEHSIRYSIERKHAENEYSRLLTAIDKVMEGIVIFNPEGIIEYANSAFGMMTGLDAEDMVGANFSELFIDNPEVCKAIGESLRDGNIWMGRVPCGKSSRRRILDTTVTPIKGENGSVESIVSISRDVTREMALEQQLSQSQKMEALGQLAGGVSHDFNNQLAAILGYAEILQSECHEGPKVKKYIKTIIETACKASELIGQLLTFSRKEVKKDESVDVHKVIEEAISLLERTINKNVTLEANLEAGRHVILGDFSQLQNAFLNLGLNARDAMPDGGKICISTRDLLIREGGFISRDVCLPAGDYLEISVTDNGCGMDEEVRRHIFEPFYTTKPEGKGTGLGLASVYGIVKSHRGHLEVNSSPGKGTSFRIYFAPVEKSVIRPKSSREKPVTGAGKILVVDDEETVRELMTDSLERLGYKVVTAANGREALDFYTKNSQGIDLVILDMNMPRMGGKETYLELKKINPDLIAIISTGFAEEMQDMIDLGLPIIRKPFSHVKLSEVVARKLAGSNR